MNSIKLIWNWTWKSVFDWNKIWLKPWFPTNRLWNVNQRLEWLNPLNKLRYHDIKDHKNHEWLKSNWSNDHM